MPYNKVTNRIPHKLAEVRALHETIPEKVKQFLHQGIQESFTTKTSWPRYGGRGRSWRPRKDTLRHPLLVKTRQLRKSFFIKKYKRPYGAELVITNHATDRASGYQYAAIHQYGGTTKGGSYMPARPFLPNTDEELDAQIGPYLRKYYWRQIIRIGRM